MQETAMNLAKAFIGESMARNRYTFYAKEAKKEGYEQVAEIFLATADNEKEHASWLFKLIQSLKTTRAENLDEIKVDAAVPTIFNTIAENLKAAIAGEHYENTIMYPEFAAVADMEGLTYIAQRLRAIAIAETHHEERYKKLLNEVEAGTVFKKDKAVQWVCRECVYTLKGAEPPEKCPACDHERSYYQVKCEEY